MGVHRIRLAAVLVVVAAALAVIPASAQAISVSGTAAPANLQAGAHSNFNLHIAFSGGTPKDLTIGLPPGEIGDPSAAPFCAIAQLNADSCPASTQVGTASTMVSLLGLLPNPLPVSGNVYNVPPQPGEPARFGIALHALPLPAPLNSLILPPVILQSGVQVDQATFGLDTIVKNVPNSAVLIGGTPISVPISITSMDLHLDGIAPGTGKPFLRNPTSCAPHHATITAVPYSGSTGVGQTPPFSPTGCGKLDFSPKFSARVGGPGQTAAGRLPTTVITSINQGPTEAGLRTAQVAVPSADFAPNLGLFGGECAPANFHSGTCPASSVVGSAVAASPLLSQPLSGNVMLVQTGGPLPNIGLDLNGQLHLLLQGSLDLTQVVTFDGLPDIPISHFELAFGPSPGLLLTNRNLCKPPSPLFHADFKGYNGGKESVDSAAKVLGCGGVLGKCKKGKRRHGHKSDASAAKKHKKHSCKRKKHKKR